MTDIDWKARAEAAEAENVRLRAALAQSEQPCVYCTLPKEEWGKCASGFPGCARADDAMGCPELGALMQLKAAEARVKAYIVHSPEDEIYGTGPDKLQFHPLAERDIESGYTQTALYAAPVPCLTVTDEMVERAAAAICKSGRYETGEGTCALACMDQLGVARNGCRHAIRIHGNPARAALTAALER